MLEDLRGKTYAQRAVAVMKLFLDNFSEEELTSFTEAGYASTKFDDPKVAPLHPLNDDTYCLELWHGPTSAFKDMALQILPHLLSASLVKNNEKKTVCILVATSGDTGKAALEGFKDVKGTKILVFYPKDGVSKVQALQMQTQEGGNVGVCAVHGNFDDAQTGVKTLFSDERLRDDLAKRGYFLSSANSINWGRILPQLVYYISAYCDLLNLGKIQMGEKVNYCVPTGNFGNILACWYAGQMGLPVGKLICASNSNNVLTDFLATGTYDRNRPFHTTMSPSMDILVSSNLERLLFALSGQDDKLVADYMQQLNKHGSYTVSDEIKAKLKSDFYGGFCSEEETGKVIAEEEVQLPHRSPHRCGLRRDGEVPPGDRRHQQDRLRLHRQPLQVLRQRAAQPGRGRGPGRHRRPGPALPDHESPRPCAPGLSAEQGRALHRERGQGEDGGRGAGDAEVRRHLWHCIPLAIPTCLCR